LINVLKVEGFMDKIDFRKELKHLYNPSVKEVSVVDVPAMNFLLVDGEGAPIIIRSMARLLRRYLVFLTRSNLWLRKALALISQLCLWKVYGGLMT
jgi:hypothetical protein